MQGTSFLKRALTQIFAYDIGGILFLGGCKALVALFPVTTNTWFYVARATGSFFLGFATWYLFMEWWYRVQNSKKARRELEYVNDGFLRTDLNLAYKFATVLLVPYTSRWMEMYTGSPESPLQKFLSNLLFICMWSHFYHVSNLIHGT